MANVKTLVPLKAILSVLPTTITLANGCINKPVLFFLICFVKQNHQKIFPSLYFTWKKIKWLFFHTHASEELESQVNTSMM